MFFKFNSFKLQNALLEEQSHSEELERKLDLQTEKVLFAFYIYNLLFFIELFLSWDHILLIFTYYKKYNNFFFWFS